MRKPPMGTIQVKKAKINAPFSNWIQKLFLKTNFKNTFLKLLLLLLFSSIKQKSV